MISKLLEVWQLLLTVIAGLVKYGPAIAAFLKLLNERAAAGDSDAATDFERGFRVLTETKSPNALRDAIARRCGPDGCLFP